MMGTTKRFVYTLITIITTMIRTLPMLMMIALMQTNMINEHSLRKLFCEKGKAIQVIINTLCIISSFFISIL